MYYPNLRLYAGHGPGKSQQVALDAGFAFLKRFGRRAAMSLAVYLLSFVPVVGRLVLPAASFYAFNRAVGPVPALAIFGVGVFLPRRYLIVFLQSYFASRSLMRELVWTSASPFHPARTRAIANGSSWNRISHESNLRQSKGDGGFATGKVCSLVLAWGFTSS